MLTIQDGGEEHEKFKELCALAASGGITPLELSELRGHLEHCESCQEAFAQYRILATEGIPALAEGYLGRAEGVLWDDSAARERLRTSIRGQQQIWAEEAPTPLAAIPKNGSPKRKSRELAGLAIAAGLLIAVAAGAYHLGAWSHQPVVVKQTSAALEEQYQKLSEEKRTAEESLAVEEMRLAQLQAESAEKEQALAKLRAALRALEARSNELMTASSQSEAELKELSQQRDELNAKLQSTSQAYGNNQTELAGLRSERDKTS